VETLDDLQLEHGRSPKRATPGLAGYRPLATTHSAPRCDDAKQVVEPAHLAMSTLSPRLKAFQQVGRQMGNDTREKFVPLPIPARPSSRRQSKH